MKKISFIKHAITGDKFKFFSIIQKRHIKRCQWKPDSWKAKMSKLMFFKLFIYFCCYKFCMIFKKSSIHDLFFRAWLWLDFLSRIQMSRVGSSQKFVTHLTRSNSSSSKHSSAQHLTHRGVSDYISHHPHTFLA